jgi:hypothetical protein
MPVSNYITLHQFQKYEALWHIFYHKKEFDKFSSPENKQKKSKRRILYPILYFKCIYISRNSLVGLVAGMGWTA